MAGRRMPGLQGHPASFPREFVHIQDGWLGHVDHRRCVWQGSALGHDAAAANYPMATGVPTRADFFDSRPSITAGQLANFIRASLRARAALRWRPIGTVVARVNSRKARSLAAGRVDLEAARKHVAAFMHLRPWLFASRDACLADSLALVNFLARYRHFPTWVFGVQTRPFAAHCWVQDGDVVFNDTPDHVRRYTPILAI